MIKQHKKLLFSISLILLAVSICLIPLFSADYNKEQNLIDNTSNIQSSIQTETQTSEEDVNSAEVNTEEVQADESSNISQVEITEAIVLEGSKNIEEDNEAPETYVPEINSADDAFIYRESIPLSYDIQLHTYNLCKAKNIRYELFLGLIKAESTFNPNEKTGSCVGLCQLNLNYHTKSAIRLCGSDDLYNPFVNITVATEILGNHLRNYNGDEHKALIAYNAGGGGAEKMFRKGITTTAYSRRVIDYSNNI